MDRNETDSIIVTTITLILAIIGIYAYYINELNIFIEALKLAGISIGLAFIIFIEFKLVLRFLNHVRG